MRVVIPNFLDEEMLSHYMSHYNQDETPNFNNFSWIDNPVLPNKRHTEYFIQYNDKIHDQVYIDYFLQKVSPYFDISRYKLRASIMRSIQIGGRSQWHSDETSKLKEEVLSITIYLNREWDLGWGGLYLYNTDGENKFYIPKFNEANCVLSPIKHSVSTIDKEAKAPRNSLQLWFYRPIEEENKTYNPELIEEIFDKPVPQYTYSPPRVEEVVIKQKNTWVNRG